MDNQKKKEYGNCAYMVVYVYVAEVFNTFGTTSQAFPK